MIGLRLQGQLGNQMFQYACARCQATRLRTHLVVHPNNYFGILNSKTRHSSNSIFYCTSGASISPVSDLFYIFNFISNSISIKLWDHIFNNCFDTGGNENPTLSYTDTIWNIKSRTEITGHALSAKYFRGFEREVTSWFSPSDHVRLEVSRLMATLPFDMSDMVAVHVRLGDYLKQGGVHSDADLGWALPPTYYQRALKAAGLDRPIALFSDDPIKALEWLPKKPDWISSATDSATDLFMMSLFPRLIVSNSTYSWWSAYLNSCNSKFIVGPRYWSGWRTQEWFPADIMVDGWVYV